MRLVDDGHDPGAATAGRARERQGKREKGGSRGAGEWGRLGVGPS
jgi:hypothetical protein